MCLSKLSEFIVGKKEKGSQKYSTGSPTHTTGFIYISIGPYTRTPNRAKTKGKYKILNYKK